MLANPNLDAPIYVLVVEDEPLSRIYASNLVEDAGLVPIEASNADEAISMLETRKDIRIVFTDINLRVDEGPQTGTCNSSSLATHRVDPDLWAFQS